MEKAHIQESNGLPRMEVDTGVGCIEEEPNSCGEKREM